MLFASGALRLCGEMSESLSARIGENLRLTLFAGLAQPKADPSQPKADPSFGGLWRSLGAKIFVEVVLLKI